MRGVKSGFFTEVDANTYKSECEWFQNIQKRMRTVLATSTGPSGKRRDVMVNGCISQKRELLVEGFCSHVMPSAAFQI